ncbi:MAG TPA: hypothetical protein VIC00_00815 [Candidatus Acidoferrales bacterium]
MRFEDCAAHARDKTLEKVCAPAAAGEELPKGLAGELDSISGKVFGSDAKFSMGSIVGMRHSARPPPKVSGGEFRKRIRGESFKIRDLRGWSQEFETPAGKPPRAKRGKTCRAGGKNY